MIEVGQFWKYADGGKFIYLRVLKCDEYKNCTVKVLKPSTWTSFKWIIGNETNYIGKSLMDYWSKLDFKLCLKCDKKNPCRKYELLCYGCRL